MNNSILALLIASLLVIGSMETRNLRICNGTIVEKRSCEYDVLLTDGYANEVYTFSTDEIQLSENETITLVMDNKGTRNPKDASIVAIKADDSAIVFQ